MKRLPSNILNFARALTFLSIPLSAANVQVPGIPNFHQVNDHIYRGGQPTEESLSHLARLGVKTVVDLRRDGEGGEPSREAEAQAVRAAGMRYIGVPMKGAPAGPTNEQMAKVLEVLDSGQPVFVHCKAGKDRTGTVIACYRIKHDHWESKKALDEAKVHGIHWYEFGMKAYIRSFDPNSPAADPKNPQWPAAKPLAGVAAQ